MQGLKSRQIVYSSIKNLLSFSKLTDVTVSNFETYCTVVVVIRQLLAMTSRKRQSKVVPTTASSPLTLTALSTLGEALKEQGKFNEAAEFYRKSLMSKEKAFGVDHPATLEVVQSLALLLEIKRNFDESEELFKRCLEGRKKMLGVKDPITCECAFNLAEMYRKLNRLDMAVDMYNFALEGYTASLGPEHQNSLVCLSRIATVQALQVDCLTYAQVSIQSINIYNCTIS